MSRMLLSMVDVLAPLLLIGAAGCLASAGSSSSTQASTPDAGPNETSAPKAAPTILVWARDQAGEPSTHRIDALDGHAIASLDGVVFAIGDKKVRWEEQRLPVASEDCPAEMDMGKVEDGFATRVVLHPIAGDATGEQEVVDPPGRDAMNQIEHAVSLLGSVGPYLFVQESEHGYGCGAHGFWSDSFFVWDAASGKKVSFADVPELIELRDEAIAKLSANKEDTFDDDDGGPKLTKLVPSWPADGRVSLGHQFTVSTAFAFSDGNWNSYTRSTLVASHTLPKELAAYAQAPAAVVAFAAAHPDLKIGGFSAE